MHKTILTALFGVVALCFASCAQHRVAQTITPDYGKFVQIAVIVTEVGDQARQVLQSAGIQCIIEAGAGDGAGFAGVWVSPSMRTRAISLLRADSVVQKSMPFVFQ